MAVYDLAPVARQMRREGASVTTDALLALWRRAASDSGCDLSGLAIEIVDPRDGRPIVGEIPDLDSVALVETPRAA